MAPIKQSTLLKRTISLGPYYKTKDSQGNKNPKFNQHCRYILDLKSSSNKNYLKAVKYFTERLGNALEALNVTASYAVAIPPSTRNTLPYGLNAVLNNLAARHNFTVLPDCLNRHTTIEKLSRGGNRSMGVHLNSVNVMYSFDEGERILLLDDVATTQNSMNACASLLERAGAGAVITAVLARTTTE